MDSCVEPMWTMHNMHVWWNKSWETDRLITIRCRLIWTAQTERCLTASQQSLTTVNHFVQSYSRTMFICILYSSIVSTATQDRWIGLRHMSFAARLIEKVSTQLVLVCPRWSNTAGSLDPRYNLYPVLLLLALRLNENYKWQVTLVVSKKT